MASDPAILPSPRDPHPPRPLGLPLRLLVALLVIIPTALDLSLQRYNLSVVYFIPLIFYAHLRRTRGLWILTLLLILLTYGCYLLDCFDLLRSNPRALWSYRLLNRTYAALGILIASYLIGSWIRFQDYWSRKTGPLAHSDAADSSFIRVEFLMDRAVATGVAILLIAAIALSDFYTPGQLNQANLYMVPLVLVGLTMNRKLLWAVVPVLLLLTYLGYAMGPAPNVEASFASVVVSSRWLTFYALLAAGVILHFWIGALTRSPSRPAPPILPREEAAP